MYRKYILLIFSNHTHISIHTNTIGPGVLIANGEQWFRSRRLLTPAFHFDILKPYVHVYNECTDVLLVSQPNMLVYAMFNMNIIVFSCLSS